MNSLLVIPVHRPWQLPLEPLAAELVHFHGRLGWPATFVLMDSCRDPDDNASRVAELRARVGPYARVLHVTRPRLVEFARALDRDLAPWLEPCAAVNYGKVANLIALVGAALQADTLTRRDSDEHLVPREGEGWWFPLERDVELLRDGAWLGGTVHYGDCDSDVDLIYDTGGPELMAELGALLGLPLDFADPAVRQRLKHPAPERMEDWSRVGPGQSVYPGLSTDRGLFRHLPVCPAEETPDVDNLPLAAATAAGWPLAAHGRLLEHRHEADRKGENRTYWLRLARAMDYNAVYAPVLAEVAAGAPDSPERLARVVQGAPRSADREARLETQERYACFLERLYPDSNLADEVRHGVAPTLAAVDAGARAHLDLLEDWPFLVARAPDLAERLTG
ncbi:MAG: hypothetical protein AB1758_08600 [Candidatus Eremiobacterota bacterium]